MRVSTILMAFTVCLVYTLVSKVLGDEFPLSIVILFFVLCNFFKDV
jgi:hypothetical protein